MADNQATPFSELSINQTGGIGVQVTIQDITGFSFALREVFWGDSTSDSGSYIGEAPGGVSTIPARLGYGNDGSVVYEQSLSGNNTIAQVDSAGVLSVLFTENVTALPALSATLGSISFASQTPEGTPYFVANYTPTGGVESSALFAGSTPTAVLKTGDALGNTALVVAGSGSTNFAIDDDAEYKQSGAYIASVQLADSSDVSSQVSEALVVSGDVALVDALPVITGQTFTGARSGLTIQVSSNPDVFEVVDEVWEDITDVAVNSSGQWIAAMTSNANSENGDDYLLVNGEIVTTVVDSGSLTGVGSSASIEAVAINEQGDYVYVYDNDLYLNDILVLDTDDTVEMTDYQIDDGVSPYSLASLVGNLQITDRGPGGTVTIYGAGRIFGTGTALSADEIVFALDFVIPEPAMALGVVGLGVLGLRLTRRDSSAA
ncbi:MAG: hypothetical protein AAFY08_05660 [Planctomycetota bacterium]